MGTEVSSPAEAGVGVAVRITPTGVPGELVPWIFSFVLDPMKERVGVIEPDAWLP